MIYPILTFGRAWALVGPVISLYFIWRVYVKSESQNSIQGIYGSSDACVYYQVGVHFICNVLLAPLQVPWIHDYLSCDIRKCVILWCLMVSIFSHLPSLLDCFIRIHDTPFYMQFHCRSPYTHLFMVVLCSWVPSFVVSSAIQYQQDEINPTVCNYAPSVSFWGSMVKALVFIGSVFSYFYTIVIIIVKSRQIQNSAIRTFNKVLLARLLAISIIVLLSFIMFNLFEPWNPESWDILEIRASYFSAVYTMGDVIAISLLPPANPMADKIMERISKITS